MSSTGMLSSACSIGLLVAATSAVSTWANTGAAVQARIDADLAAGKPILVHAVVALCDNSNQGIVPVPEALGNGQNPESNLYWGALYGVRTHLPRAAGWTRIDVQRPENERILDRVVLHTTVKRADVPVPVYVVADAWDGASIHEALRAYLEMAAGRSADWVEVTVGSESIGLHAGGASHLVAYVGHNGLMDFALDPPVAPQANTPMRSAVVLACASKSYFLGHLEAANAHPLLLTTGLMAPEAYTLDSAIRAWLIDGATVAVVEAAAEAYNQYQKCGLGAAKRLFWGAP